MNPYPPSSNLKFIAESSGDGGLIPLAALPPMYYNPPPPPPLLLPPYIQPPPYLIPSYSAPAPPPPPPTTMLSHIPRRFQYIPPPLTPPPDMFTYFPPPSLQSLVPPPPPPVAFIPPPPPPPPSPPPPSPTVAFIHPPPPPSEPCPQSSLLGSEHTDNRSAAGTEDANLSNSMHYESRKYTQIFCKRKETKKYLADKQQCRDKESASKIFEMARRASFIGRMEFRNELPDPTNQLKLLPLKDNNVRFSKNKITSLEKLHKPELYPEADLGIPLDLLDLSVFNPPHGVKFYLDPEDQELLHDDDIVSPITKGSLKRKERPSAKDIPWLLKSPLSKEKKKQPLVEKQVKELPYLNDSDNREKKLQEIDQATQPGHGTDQRLHPTEVPSLLPDSNRDNNQLVIGTSNSVPSGESAVNKNIDHDADESKAIMNVTEREIDEVKVLPPRKRISRKQISSDSSSIMNQNTSRIIMNKGRPIREKKEPTWMKNYVP